MMGKLIDHDAAIEYLMTNMGWHDEDGREVDDADEKRKIITDLVNGIPTVDTVCVVRCKDCKYWALADRYDGIGYGACTHYKTIVRKGVLLSENFFCFYGARMDGGDDDANGT